MTARRHVQTADPRAAYQAAADEILAAIRRVLESGQYILGPEVEAFEREFAKYLGAAHVVSVASGTDALELALRAAGLKPGDRVVTVANTATATVAAIELAGAKAVFVDIDPHSMTMDPDALEACLVKAGDAKPKAVVPVHLYGHPADLLRIGAIAQAHGLAVIEDCAQAHGATIGGRRVGTFGVAAAFSFYPTKNLGAIGDGGAVSASDARLVEQVRLLRQYGWRQRYISESPGKNSRLDELQAAILRVKLARLEVDNQRRRTLAGEYLRRLAGAGLELPTVPPEGESVWHQFVVRTPAREALRAHLANAGIQTSVLYPVPIHRQPAYRDDSLQLPATEQACRELLCLPMHAGLGLADVELICRHILKWSAAQR
ncbi:MAG TPA: DegT/DnrJ/EryC1/StrS family aminotransferase [Opitutaceae bacterium]|nr:DegT/DnrJ/EryC1/StrS family aminotransferase [Opitutaceae bacterium]